MTTAATTDALRDAAEAFAGAERPDEAQWLRQLRRDAASAFSRLGLPGPKDESWRHTNVSALARVPFHRPEETAHARPVVRKGYAPTGGGARLVFVDGRLDPKASSMPALPPGVKTGSVGAVLKHDPGLLEPTLGRLAPHQKHPFVALNTALLTDGAFLFVPKGCVLTDPIHVVFVSTLASTPKMTHPRLHVWLGENSQATIVESYAGADEGTALTNAVTEVVLGAHALLDHNRIQEEGRSTFHIGTTSVHLASGAQYVSHSFTLGGGVARHELAAHLHGEGAGCTLDGFYAASGAQTADNRTFIDHAKPHGSSQELYKGILDGSAKTAFEGKIVVRPGAQKTDAHQRNNNLILSEDALADSRPELEIYNDDVRCTHGSTTGQLDPDAFFYLRSRGLDPASARALLTYAFASEVTSRVKDANLRGYLEGWLLSWLPRNGGLTEARP